MPENQNFYIIEHGVRLTAMPGWEGVLNQDQAWKVTTFLSHMDKLPSSVEKEWKASPGQFSHSSWTANCFPNLWASRLCDRYKRTIAISPRNN